MAIPDEAKRLLYATFAEEADEAFEEMTRALLDLSEGRGEVAPQLLVLRRHAHSLKGASGSIELSELSTTFHAFEDVIAAWPEDAAPGDRAIDASLRFFAALREAVHLAVKSLSVTAADPALERARAELKAAQAVGGRRAEPKRPRKARRAQEAPSSRVEGEAGPPAPAYAPTPRGPGEITEAVRVPAGVLDAALRRSEELAALSSYQRGRVAGLRELSGRVHQAARAATHADDAEARQMLLGTLADVSRTLVQFGQDAERTSEVAERVSTQVREDLRRLRLQPMALLHEALRLALRDAARRLERAVRLDFEGAEVRVDRRILDGVRDPLIHLVRNAVAHGIEAPAERERAGKPAEGRVLIRAEARGPRVLVAVFDDGRGIDASAVGARAAAMGLRPAGAPPPSPDELRSLILAPGLSTAAVDEVSGRGVGLDVVRRNVTELRGLIEVISEPGVGTRFVLDLPLTLASMRGLFLRAGEHTVVVPSLAVDRIVSVGPGELGHVGGRPVLAVTGVPVPYVSLAEALGAGAGASASLALVLRVADRKVAVGVEAVTAEEEVTISALVPAYRGARLFSGAVVRPTGEVYLVADPAALAAIEPKEAARAAGDRAAQQKRILVVDDSVTTRSLHRHVLEAQGYEVVTAEDGDEALALLEQADKPCALVVSDVFMPRMSGFEMTRRIRATDRFRRLPVVLVSSLGSEEDRRAGIESGANVYIVKQEYDAGALLDVVRRLA